MARSTTPLADRTYRWVIAACATAIPVLLLLLAVIILRAAWPALRHSGAGFVFGGRWDVSRAQFGALPVVVGTLLSSLLALLIAGPLAIGTAIFTTEFAPRWLRAPVAFAIDLLAAIPSVVYGLWGLVVLVPLLRQSVMPILQSRFGSLPIFGGPAYGPSLLAAVLVLSIMIIPYIAAVSREVLAAVPRAQREAALALGATPWEAIRDAVLPFARSGLFGGMILGLGRALGETMAVTMVIGNRHAIPDSLLDPTYTMASLLANEFGEASSRLHLSALMAVAGLLLLITLVVNVVARVLVWRVSGGAGIVGVPAAGVPLRDAR
ncbi:MAG TPA: phosphate ABC transporter permease subunit PstC [Gemmatimonas sp.]|nr:phosphate ABC transporter permease subunit PstC [Gemmatimonas sp.]